MESYLPGAIWTCISVLLMVIVAVAYIRFSRYYAQREAELATPPLHQNNMTEYYTQPGYRHGREMLEYMFDSAALAEQRKSGRHPGGARTACLNLTETNMSDFEIMNHAKWLMAHGASSNVHIQFMDGDTLLTESQALARIEQYRQKQRRGR